MEHPNTPPSDAGWVIDVIDVHSHEPPASATDTPSGDRSPTAQVVLMPGAPVRSGAELDERAVVVDEGLETEKGAEFSGSRRGSPSMSPPSPNTVQVSEGDASLTRANAGAEQVHEIEEEQERHIWDDADRHTYVDGGRTGHRPFPRNIGLRTMAFEIESECLFNRGVDFVNAGAPWVEQRYNAEYTERSSFKRRP